MSVSPTIFQSFLEPEFLGCPYRGQRRTPPPFPQSWEANFLGFPGIHLENIAIWKRWGVWLRGGESACAQNIEKAVPTFSMV